MRVTSSMMVRSTLRDLSSSLERLQDAQNRATSGKQLLRPSNNPTATAAAMTTRQELRRSEQMVKEAEDAKGWLSTADAALTSGLDLLRRANDVVVAARNAATSDPATRQSFALELRSLRAELLSIANTKYADRSIFNGNAAGAAYDATGAYLGDTGDVVRDVAPSLSVTVNVTGPTVFGTAGGPVGNLFEVLDRLATAVETGNDTAIAAEQANLAAARDAYTAATATIGVRAARMEQIETRAADDKLRLLTQLSNAEDIDVVDALIQVKQQETRYQASLQVAARIIPPSLMDFLR